MGTRFAGRPGAGAIGVLLAAGCALAAPITGAQTGDPCVAPGMILLTDPEGDWSGTISSISGQDGVGTPEQDLLSLALAQTEANGEILLHFTLQTAAAPSLLLPNAVWFVSFQTQDELKYGVRMQTNDQGVPSFFSYAVAAGGLNDDGPGDGRFVEEGSAQPLEPGSGYTPDGRFTFIVKASTLDLQPGDFLLGFNAASIQGGSVPLVVSFAFTMDEMPAGLGRIEGFYELGRSCGGSKSRSGLLLGGHLSWSVLTLFLFGVIGRLRGYRSR